MKLNADAAVTFHALLVAFWLVISSFPLVKFTSLSLTFSQVV